MSNVSESHSLRLPLSPFVLRTATDRWIRKTYFLSVNLRSKAMGHLFPSITWIRTHEMCYFESSCAKLSGWGRAILFWLDRNWKALIGRAISSSGEALAFLGNEYPFVTNTSTFWFGWYNNGKNEAWNRVEGLLLTDIDSTMTFTWQNLQVGHNSPFTQSDIVPTINWHQQKCHFNVCPRQSCKGDLWPDCIWLSIVAQQWPHTLFVF
jgi:hypothetical protein